MKYIELLPNKRQIAKVFFRPILSARKLKIKSPTAPPK